MESRIILFLCLFAASALAWYNPRSFQGSGSYTYNGKTFTGTQVWYDYNLKRLAIRVNFPDSSNMVELFHFDTKQRFQQCSFTTNCLNTVWNQQQWVWFVDSAAGGVAETVNGVACYRFSVPQSDGWSSTIWFAQAADGQGNNLLVRVDMSKSGETRSFTLSGVTYPVSNAPFTPAQTCGTTTCYAQLDLMLVLDDSDSISSDSWTQGISFAINVVNSFPRISNNDVRIGVVTFSTSPVLQIPLSSNRTSIINTLNNINRQRAETGISLGISTAQSQLTTNGRSGVNKAMIVLTDGVPNVPAPPGYAVNETRNQANLARNAGTVIYAIGVGSQTNIQTLYLMASTPYSDFVSLVSSFSDLNSIQDTLVKSVCPGNPTDTCNCNGNRGICACSTCKCANTGCGNGNLNSDCSCTCTSPWTLDASGSCTVCDTNAGAQLQCNGRGTITNTQTCSGCNCQPPWTGADCGTCGISDCGRGTLNSATCSCTCNANWGKDSSGRCTVCNFQCRNGGTPVTTCDSCTCTGPWTGTDCSTCQRPGGYCQNGGTLNQNTCNCNCLNSWAGSDCSTCNFNCNGRGTTNANCNGCLCQDCIRGTFNANCLCTCPNYWTRAPNGTCTVCDTATASTNLCSGRGTVGSDCVTCTCNQCSNGGTVNANCSCNCVAPYAYNTNTKDCTTCLNTRQNFCNNHGTVTGCVNCNCDTNWGGVNCGTCTATDAVCSNGGTINSTTCTCKCNGNWTGPYCQTCGLNCNGRATTTDPTCSFCNCNAPWGGATCTNCTRTQAFCSRGTLDSAQCLCTCPAGTGWQGADCNTCGWTGANRCNGRGTVQSDCATCNCTAPWTGNQCQTCGLPQGYCGTHGTINTGSCTCTCDAGWGGAQCNVCTRTDTYCGGPTKGRIDNTTCGCICNPPWTGATCNQCSRPPSYCQNGGTVSADCMTCTCPGGFTGQYCQSCDLQQNCGNGFLNASTCTCQCYGGWSGARCSVCPNNQAQCGPYSSWNQSACACNCDPDYNWSGTLCTNCNINCNTGVSLVQIGFNLCDCLCYGSYVGKFCNVCNLTDATCGNGHVRTGDCTCQCNSGWVGEACGRCALLDTGCPTGFTLNATSCQCLCPSNSASAECCARIDTCDDCNRATGCHWCNGQCLLEEIATDANCTSEVCGTTTGIAEAESPSEEGTNNIVPAAVAGAILGAAAIGGAAAAVGIYRLKKSGKKLNIGKRLSRVFGNVTDNPLYKQAAVEGHNPMFESGHGQLK